MIALALTFLRSPLGKFAAIALAVILALWGVHHVGYSVGIKANEARHVKALEKAQKRVLEAEKQGRDITDRERAKLALANQKIDTLTNQLRKELPRYVSPQADRRCTIPAGYVLLRNAAGTGEPPIPGPSGQSLDADSGLALSALAENDIENGRSFQAAIAEIEAWRAWYVQQAETFNATSRAKP